MLSSPLAGDGKKRDPGNEVGTRISVVIVTHHLLDISFCGYVYIKCLITGIHSLFFRRQTCCTEYEKESR